MARWVAAACAAAAMTIAAGCGGGANAPAPAVPAEPSVPASSSASPDDQQFLAAYLAAIDARGGGFSVVSPDRLLTTGRTACDGLAAGQDPDEVILGVRSEREGYTRTEAITIIGAAVEVLCPDQAAQFDEQAPPATSAPPVAPDEGLDSSGEEQFRYGCEQGIHPG